MDKQGTIEFIKGRIERLEKRFAILDPTASRTSIARLEGRLDAMEEILALLKDEES
jgi:hypothetical protein